MVSVPVNWRLQALGLYNFAMAFDGLIRRGFISEGAFIRNRKNGSKRAYLHMFIEKVFFIYWQFSQGGLITGYMFWFTGRRAYNRRGLITGGVYKSRGL